jgi:hypothetical protein
LIDEYEFLVHPIVAGHGPTLFAGLSERLDLKLVDRQEFRSGRWRCVTSPLEARRDDRLSRTTADRPPETGNAAAAGRQGSERAWRMARSSSARVGASAILAPVASRT